MEILEVQPLRMIPPQEFASNSGNVSDFCSSKVAASPSNSANWLPPGWTVENRTAGRGSPYKVYKDPDTGMKFYSRTKVLEYLQDPTSRRTPSKRMRAETTPCNEHPNWLPPDWVVAIKTKMSGGTVGTKYKVYVEKSTGKKFYSKRQALDYLKPSNSSSPETKDAQSTGSEDHPDWSPQGCKTETESDDGAAERKYKVNHTKIEVTDVEGLPPGWFKAIRYKESKVGLRYKVAIYVDPISGYAFFSTKDALRYIDNGHIKDCRMRPTLWSKISNDIVENKFHSTGSEDHPDWSPQGWKTETESDDGAAERKYKANHTKIEVTDVEGLPPGWFKAISYRESKVGLSYKVAIYVDPISGYAFFSTKDAQRYIDNGHIKDCRVRPTLWSKISNDIVENKFHSQPTAQERELKQEGRKGKRPLFSEENYEKKSEEDIIDIDDSDEENGSTPKEMRVKRPLFSEEISENKSEDVTEPDDLPIGTEKAVTAEIEKEKMPEAPVLKRTRVKVCATKGSPSLRSSKSTSPKALPSNPSSVNPVQTNQKDNGENPESEQKKDIPEQASTQQGDEVSPSLLGEPSMDSCLEFAYKTLTEDILVLDKDEEI
ncbi:uncharacterized protein LOC144576335 isoform X1 [Carex rostrata]